MGYHMCRRKGGLAQGKAIVNFRIGLALMCLIILLAISGCQAGGNSVSSEAFRERKEFADFISRAESQFVIPGLDEDMTPQGISYSEKTGLVYITSYAMDDGPSTISAVSLETGEQAAEYRLFNSDGTPFTGHVGGIAVTEDQVYLSAKLDSDGSYSVAILPLADLPVSENHDVTIDETIPLPVSPSFLNYSQEILWVGNFYHPSADYGLSSGIPYTTATDDGEYGCYILGYRLGADGLAVPADEMYPVPDLVLAAPDKIQGMVHLADSVVLSQSYGRKNNSALLVYGLTPDDPPDTTLDICGHTVPAYVLDSLRLREKLTVMPMSEGLCLSPKGVLVLFESGSSRYSNGKYRTNQVWAVEME